METIDYPLNPEECDHNHTHIIYTDIDGVYTVVCDDCGTIV